LWLGVVVAVGMLAVCGSVASTSWASGPRVVCGPSSARALASDRTARVYVSAGDVYGCAAGGSKSYLLGSANMCGFQRQDVQIVRVAGPLAAYARELCGTDFGSTTVIVRRLTDGRVLQVHDATTTIGVEGFQDVGSLVLTADGAVAWIATADSIGPPTFVRQLARLDRRGFRVLDSGPAVVVRSLTLRGSTISWRHGTEIRTARLSPGR
jgi:hypothetical protein